MGGPHLHWKAWSGKVANAFSITADITSFSKSTYDVISAVIENAGLSMIPGKPPFHKMTFN